MKSEEEQLHRAAIACLAGDEELRQRVVLRGAAALRLFYNGLRPIRDFDLVVLRAADESREGQFTEPDRTVNLLRNRLSKHLHLYYTPCIGSEAWIDENLHFDVCVCGERIECSRREIVVGSGETLLVSTAEDILASKLTVMFNDDPSLHQRPQDLFDVAHLIVNPLVKVNAVRVIELARVKALNRGVRFGVTLFDGVTRFRITRDYENYRSQMAEKGLDAEDAWSVLSTFLRQV